MLPVLLLLKSVLPALLVFAFLKVFLQIVFCVAVFIFSMRKNLNIKSVDELKARVTVAKIVAAKRLKK